PFLELLRRLELDTGHSKAACGFVAYAVHKKRAVALTVGDGAHRVAQVAEHLAGLGRHHLRIGVRGVASRAQRTRHLLAQRVRASWELTNLDEASVVETVVVHDAGLEEDARYDDQDAVDPAEVANGRRLIGDAVLAAQDGQRMRIAASGTDVYEGLIRILRLDAQQHHVLVGKADVLDAADG